MMRGAMQVPGFQIEVATVRCEPSGRELKVAAGTTLLDACQQLGAPLSQGCEGIALCGFCRVHVTSGGGSLSPLGEEERKVLASMHAGSDERLACCARVHGDVVVTTDYW
jgi:ferredoxin